MFKDYGPSFVAGLLAFLAASLIGKWFGVEPSLSGGGSVVTMALGKVFYDKASDWFAKRRDPNAGSVEGTLAKATAMVAGGATMLGGSFVG